CIASLCFRGNQASARAMLQQHGYIPHMLSKSRFSRRLHRLKDIFLVLFDLLAQTWKTLNKDAIYVIDSIPIAVCDNIRIRRSKGCDRSIPTPLCRQWLLLSGLDRVDTSDGKRFLG